MFFFFPALFVTEFCIFDVRLGANMRYIEILLGRAGTSVCRWFKTLNFVPNAEF